MKIHDGLERFHPPAAGVVLTIGNFDGVHRGHRRLVERARQTARALDLTVVVVTFEPHPLTILAPRRAPERLTTLEEKTALLETLGVDATIVMRSNHELLDKTAERFLADLVEFCRPQVIVEGPTFRFGRGREGRVETLRDHARRLGFNLALVDEIHSGELAGNPAINSSAIRKALRQGRLGEANTMLGRPYRITGTVASGDHRGKSLGFPTANLIGIPQLVPQNAVYAAVAQRADQVLHLAAVNIGPQPTFAQRESRVEAHLLDYSGDLHDERIGLHLLARLRGQTAFEGADQLAAQLECDVEQTRRHADQLARIRAGPIVPL